MPMPISISIDALSGLDLEQLLIITVDSYVESLSRGSIEMTGDSIIIIQQ